MAVMGTLNCLSQKVQTPIAGIVRTHLTSLRAFYLALRLKPIVQLVTVCSSALLVKFVGALLNLLLNRDQDGRLVRLRCER